MTTSISTMDAREKFSELINRVSHNNECIILTRRDKPIVALVPMEDFLLLEETRNKRLLAEAIEALKEARVMGTESLVDLKAALGE